MSIASVSSRALSRPAPVASPVRVQAAAVRPLDAFESAAKPGAPKAFRTYGRGRTGAEVVTLQERLVGRGFLRAHDMATGRGVFGPRTEAAVRRLQIAHGLPVTGMVDARTAQALVSRLRPAMNEISEVPTARMAPLSARPSETLSEEVTAPIALPLRRDATNA